MPESTKYIISKVGELGPWQGTETQIKYKSKSKSSKLICEGLYMLDSNRTTSSGQQNCIWNIIKLLFNCLGQQSPSEQIIISSLGLWTCVKKYEDSEWF